ARPVFLKREISPALDRAGAIRRHRRAHFGKLAGRGRPGFVRGAARALAGAATRRARRARAAPAPERRPSRRERGRARLGEPDRALLVLPAWRSAKPEYELLKYPPAGRPSRAGCATPRRTADV